MRKEKRILSIALTLLVTASLFTGCKKEGPAETTAVPVETTITAAPAAEAVTEPVTETEAPTEAASEKEYDITVPNFPFRRATFPVMDGSTAAVPLGKAIASTLLSETMEEVADLCTFHRTTQSFRNLSAGLCDILVVGEPNAAVYEEMEAAGFRYDLREIATDALIFVVNEENPVENLTTDEIRDIYTGKITNWKEVGGNDAEIIPFQRNEGAGSQALIKKLIMGDTEMMAPPTELVAGSMGDLMTCVRDYDGSANALGYSVYYYANDMKMAKGLKIISVDGVEPSAETIRKGEYPHLNAYYCVIPSDPSEGTEEEKLRAEGARVIYDWLGTAGGQNLVASMGYVSVMDVGEGRNNREELPGDFFTLIDGKEPGELTAREDYGMLIPYAGIPLYENYEDGSSYQAGNYYGFFDENGRIASAPLYPFVEVLTRYNSRTGTEEYIPVYAVSERQEGVETDEYGNVIDGYFTKKLVTADGKFISEKEYAGVEVFPDGIRCTENFDYDHFDYLGIDGTLLFTEEDLLKANPGMGEKLNEYRWMDFRSFGAYYTMELADGTYVIDPETLTIIAGPYAGVTDYAFGLFKVCDGPSWENTTRWGLVNTQFETVIPFIHEEIEILENGGATGLTEGRVTVYDAEGKETAHLENVTGVYPTCYGFEAHRYEQNSGTATRYCDFAGKVLFEDDEYVTTGFDRIPVITMPARLSDDGEAVLTDGEATGYYVYQLETEEGVFLENVDSVYPFYTVEGTSPIPCLTAIRYSYEEGEKDVSYILPTDLSEMYEAGCSVYAAADQLTGEWYIVTYDDWEDDDFRLLNADLTVAAEGLPSGFEIRDGLILYQTDNAFIAEKPNGTVVFRYSLIKSLGD